MASALGLVVAGAIVLSGPQASAKSSYESSYGFDKTWNAAVRLVRVDMGLKVTEKDEQNGYLLFDYHSSESGPKTSPGSFEIVRPKDPGGPVRVVVQLSQMPRYHEQVLLDSLSKKLRQEYGDPPAPVRHTVPDAGAGEASPD
jgi:hypothetical protein